jgi:REP element-mobilizing transposase RayT
MREPRIKVPAEKGEALYHCTSRVVGGQRLLDAPAREVFRRQMWTLVEFCGVELVTYDLLSNHVHLLVHVPQKTAVPDAELLRRFALRHPGPDRRQLRLQRSAQALLARNSEAAAAWRPTLT